MYLLIKNYVYYIYIYMNLHQRVKSPIKFREEERKNKKKYLQKIIYNI